MPTLNLQWLTDDERLHEQAEVIVDIIHNTCETTAEALRVLTLQSLTAGWIIHRLPGGIAFQYGKSRGDCIVCMAKHDGSANPLINCYDNSLFTVLI